MALNYEIKIEKESNDLFDVMVKTDSETHHKVKLSDEYWQKLTDEKISKEELIKKSFEFLLEREPNTSILSEFELQRIAFYFPGFEKVIRQSL